MVNALRTIAYHLKRDKRLRAASLLIIGLMGWRLSSVLLFALLGLSGLPRLWDVFVVLGYGLVLPTLLAFAVVFMPVIGGYFWLKGGIWRAMGNPLILFWAGFILSSTVALFIFVVYQGIEITPYPWRLYGLLLRVPVGSQEYRTLMMCLGLSYGACLILVIYPYVSSQNKANKVFGNAHFATNGEIHRSGLYAKRGLVLGRIHGETIRFPGFESALVVAPTGSGKTACIAVPNLLEWEGSGVFNDLKGELYQLTASYRKNVLKNDCYCFSPADPSKKTACYNPFFYVSMNPQHRIRDCQLIAETLIPSSRLGDGFWYQSSREIFLTLSLYLLETKGMATLSEIHDLSKQEDFFQWLFSEVSERESCFSKQLTQNAYAILGSDEKTQKNILKDFHSRMGLFNDPIVGHATSRNDVDFREIRRKKISIYIQIPDSDKARLSPLLTLFWAQLIHVISHHEPRRDEPHGVLALMDEFGNMSRIDKLKDGLSFLRSYHLRCIMIVQYLGQIRSVYGRDDAKGFLNSKVKVAFALNDMDDAEFFSKSLGSKTVTVSSSSVSTGQGNHGGSRSQNQSYRSRALLSPDEMMQLAEKKAVILVEARQPLLVNKCYWFKAPVYTHLLRKVADQRHTSHERPI